MVLKHLCNVVLVLRWHEAHLNIGWWSLLQPGLDWLQRVNIFNHSLETSIFLNQIGLGHVVQIVKDASEIQIGPCQLRIENDS